MTITTTQFLTMLRSEVVIPTNQQRFSDTNLLLLADQELGSTIMPFLTSIRQEFQLQKDSLTIVADQAEYKIPYRAYARTVRSIRLRLTDEEQSRSLAYVELDDSESYGSGGSGDPTGFTIRGDKIILLPTPSSALGYLDVTYPVQHPKLVALSECGTIASFDDETGIVTLDAAVSTFASNDAMDFIDHRQGCALLARDKTCSNVAGTALSFTAADLPSDLAAGNYVAKAAETPVLQIPDNLTDVLISAVGCRVLLAQGDFEALKSHEKVLEEKIKRAGIALVPRVEAQAPVVINRNGLLHRPRAALFRGRYSP